MTRSQTTKAVKLIRAAEALRAEANWSERSFATLHLADGLRRQQHNTENELVRLMRPIYEALTMAEGMALSTRLHRLAGV